jgi:hypothetical protein
MSVVHREPHVGTIHCVDGWAMMRGDGRITVRNAAGLLCDY